jgi:general secretion pathway protein L
MLPSPWQTAWKAIFVRPVLDTSDATWHLTGLGSDVSDITLDSRLTDEELRESLRRLFPDGLASSVGIILRRDEALFRRLVLPAAAAPRLRSVVRLQLDRLSPFRGDDIYFDCAVYAAGDTGAGEICVEVVLLPKAVLSKLEHRLRTVGLVPRHFRFNGSDLELSPIGLPLTKQRRKQLAFAAFGCFAWLSAVLLAPHLADSEVSALQSEITAAAPQTNRALRLKSLLEGYQLPPEAISAHRADAIEILATLTRLLPKPTHITEFNMENGAISLRGTAETAASLQTKLMRSGLFRRVEPLGGSNTSGQFAFKLILRAEPEKRDR